MSRLFFVTGGSLPGVSTSIVAPQFFDPILHTRVAELDEWRNGRVGVDLQHPGLPVLAYRNINPKLPAAGVFGLELLADAPA